MLFNKQALKRYIKLDSLLRSPRHYRLEELVRAVSEDLGVEVSTLAALLIRELEQFRDMESDPALTI